MIQPKPIRFTYLQQESYLAVIKNSVGSKMFRSFMVKKSGRKFDVLKSGNLSCAYYVSTVLRMFGLVEKLHFTVGKTADDLLVSGAKKVSKNRMKPGDVIFWVSKKTNAEEHNHIGFFVGGTKAISNSEKKREIALHHITFNNTREIELVLRPNWKKTYAKS